MWIESDEEIYPPNIDRYCRITDWQSAIKKKLPVEIGGPPHHGVQPIGLTRVVSPGPKLHVTVATPPPVDPGY